MRTYEQEQQNMNQSITLLTDSYTDEDGETHIGYGFAVCSAPGAPPFFSAEDLSTDRAAVESLIRTIRSADVSPVHYMDIVEDFLT